MFNVLIVDDEDEIRNGLKLKIQWDELGFQVAGEASNGIEALEALKTGNVHVLITDIRMPFMDGISLLQQCSRDYPRIKTVILSGYDDFSYMKTAIQNKATDYLLKPVIRKELIEVLKKIDGELQKEMEELVHRDAMEWTLKKNALVLQEQVILDLLGSHDEHPITQEKINSVQLEDLLNTSQTVQFITIEMRIPNGRLGDRLDQQDLLNTAFQMFCREYVQKSEFRCAVFHDPWHSRMMHYIVKVESHVGYLQKIEDFVRRLQRDINHFLKVMTIIGVGAPITGISMLKEGYTSSFSSWSKGLVGSNSQVIWPDQRNDSFIDITVEVERRIVTAIDHLDQRAFETELRRVINNRQGHSRLALSYFYIRMNVLLDASVRKHGIDPGYHKDYLWPHTELLRGFLSGEDVLEDIFQRASRIIDQIARRNRTGGSQVIEAIQKYIDHNYAEDITLSLMAERHFLNQTYLSELFKKQTGTTFSDYLTHVRLNKAVDLLMQSSYKLADVAEATGFSNASYFSNVFKKHYGITPNDYRMTYFQGVKP